MTNTVKSGEFCWNELMTTDVKECKKFYSSLFGWETHEEDMGQFTYTLFKKDDRNVGGMMQIPQEQQQHIPPHWMSYINVDNVEETVSKAKTLGAVIKQEPFSIGDFGRLAVLQDPSGAHTAIWESTQSCC